MNTTPAQVAFSRLLVFFFPKDLYSLATGWCIGAKKEQLKHEINAKSNERYDFWIGWSAIITQAIIATSVFASFMKSQVHVFHYVAIGVTLLNSVLIAISTKKEFGRKAEAHHRASSRIKCIIQELERLITDTCEFNRSENQSVSESPDRNS